MRLELSQTMTNAEVADLFEFIADVLILKGQDHFRVQAYQVAADTIRHLQDDLAVLIGQHHNLEDLAGIGKTLAAKLNELYTTGEVAAFQSYVADLPGGMWPLTKVPGIGGKRAYKLCLTLKLDAPETALAQLKQAAEAGKVRTIPGFGEKSEKEILAALANFDLDSQRLSLEAAQAIAQGLISELKNCQAITQIQALGSIRREQSTVGDIDLGIATHNMGLVKDFVKNMKNVKKIIAAGDQLLRLHLTNGQRVDIKAVPPSEWGSFIQHFTGSKAHNIQLRVWALKQGKSLSEHGIKDLDSGQTQTYSDEKAFYHDLGLDWIPPEERVGENELERHALHK